MIFRHRPHRLHPGEILLEDFASALLNLGDLDAWAEGRGDCPDSSLESFIPSTAERTGLPVETVEALFREQVPVTEEIAVALDAAYGTPPGWWLRFQASYDAGERRTVRRRWGR